MIQKQKISGGLQMNKNQIFIRCGTDYKRNDVASSGGQ